MKKTFFQMGLGFILTMAVLGLFLFAGLYMLYGAIIYDNILMYVIGIVGSAFMLFQMGRMCFHRVVFFETEIRVPNDKLEKIARIQYETIIPYEEIIDIRLVLSSNDSRNKPINSGTPSALSPKTYFEFLMSSGAKKRIFILYFSKKQREKMLSIINKKTGSCYQYDQLLKDKDLG